MYSDKLQTLLNDSSKYHIEFNGHLTNHAKHAVVALYRLEVPINEIEDYYNNYCGLTPYNCHVEILNHQ